MYTKEREIQFIYSRTNKENQKGVANARTNNRQGAQVNTKLGFIIIRIDERKYRDDNCMNHQTPARR